MACVAVVLGVPILSWKQDAVRPGFKARSLLWPNAGAVVRRLAQAAAKAGLLLWASPFAAGRIGYLVSLAIVTVANQAGRARRLRPTKVGVAWFVVTGVLNGGAVLLMYGALNLEPVSLVAPAVPTYPLVTALASALVLHEEPVTLRMMAGATITVLAIVYLVASSTGA